MQPIYLYIDHTRTDKALKAFIDNYNERIKLLEPESYKRKSVKTTHLTTALVIKKMFSQFLYTNARLKLTGAPFKINNQAVATCLEAGKKGTKVAKSTIWRHVTKLIECGVLQNKAWHGSNSSYEIELNPAVLVAESNLEYTELIISRYAGLTGEMSLSEEKLAELSTLRPSFLEAPLGCMVATCMHIASGSLPELKSNIVSSGVVDSVAINNDFSNTILPEHESINSNSAASPGCTTNTKTEVSEQEHAPGPAVERPVKNASNELAKLINFHIERAWAVLLSMFYRERYLSEHEISMAKAFLYQYFSAAHTKRSLASLSNQYFERLTLVYFYVKKSPAHFMPRPGLWLDPRFKHGFAGTRDWLEKDKLRRAEIKGYNQNRKRLAELLQDYYAEPTALMYQKASQELGKKRDKELLDLFNRCVLDAENFKHKTFETYNSPYLWRDPQTISAEKRTKQELYIS
jgi:hypothetical protein